MRNSSKINTLESKFPILAIEQDCLLTKEADISVGFEVQLPELFTISGEDYEILHSLWHKAIKVLPQYTVIHKQDWFIKEQYEPELQGENLSFLSHSYEKHFNERPFLNHRCYLFITQTTKNRMRAQSNFSSLCKGNFLPKELTNREHATQFLEAVAQLERILNDSNLIKLHQLKTEDYIGTPHKKGLFEQYLSLSTNEKESLQDICLSAEQMRIGNQRLCVHTLSDTEDLPSKVQADSRYERLSTDKSDCRLSFAAPVGLLLSCNHIYNQYLFLDNSDENLRQFEKSARNMHSLSRYSRSNQINKEWIEQYLNEAHSYGLSSIRAHFNVMAWSDTPQELRSIKNDVGSALASMECKPRHNTIDTATLYWAGIAGNAADFPSEETFYTFIEPALCFFTQETNYQSSSSPFGIKMADRLTGKPIHLDISDEPMKKGIITNRNKFVLGPSGSGKSFFTNHLVRQYYEQGTHIVLVDTGNSYQGVCELIHHKTKGKDGIYFTYTEDNPIAKEGMAEYIKYLFKTVRKFFGEAVIVTQEVDDIIHSPIVKESIINNSDCKILLDQRKYMNKFNAIQAMLGLTEKEKSQILSINLSNDSRRKYKEVWIGLGGTHSAVYATEVSREEYFAYTTEESEKHQVMELSEKLDGNLEKAIVQMANGL